MNIKNYVTHKNIIIMTALVLFLFVMGAWQVYTLQIAHSSFENYYAFRGCVQLLEKTEDYATCKLSSGETIKLVKVGTKWFLDGDLGW